MQNSFYPRRSGDVILNLMPGWIEEQRPLPFDVGVDVRLRHRSAAGIRRHGAGQQRVQRRVDMTAVAPTLARLAGVTRTRGLGGRRPARRSWTCNRKNARKRNMDKKDQIQEEIIEEFSVFDDWLDKYDYLIGLSDSLPAIAPRTPHRTVPHRGMPVARVGRRTARTADGFSYAADSDAIITKGIIALLDPRTERTHAAGGARHGPLFHRRHRPDGQPLAHAGQRAGRRWSEQMRLYALAYASKND